MKKDFLQPKIEFICLNDITVLMNSFDVDNVEKFPENPNQETINGV